MSHFASNLSLFQASTATAQALLLGVFLLKDQLWVAPDPRISRSRDFIRQELGIVHPETGCLGRPILLPPWPSTEPLHILSICELPARLSRLCPTAF